MVGLRGLSVILVVFVFMRFFFISRFMNGFLVYGDCNENCVE